MKKNLCETCIKNDVCESAELDFGSVKKCKYYFEAPKHGKWVDCDDNNYCKCSICGLIVLIEEITNYCGACGAKNGG